MSTSARASATDLLALVAIVSQDRPDVPSTQGLPPNGVALGELQGAEQVELDSAGDVADGRLAGPAPGCPRVDAWPLVTVRQAPGRGGDVPECGRRSARSLPGP
jgi:hypothetical protein